MPSDSSPIIPPVFFFRPLLACPNVPLMPAGGKGSLLKLPETALLPNFSSAEEAEQDWAQIRVAWNARGLGIAVDVKRPKTAPELSEESDGPELVIDTRDIRDNHRASKFCHLFKIGVGSAGDASLLTTIRQQKIKRATSHPPATKLDQLAELSARRTGSGYSLEVFLPAETLHGYDPETHRRLGFSIWVHDSSQRSQFLTVGNRFPIAEDPSLWTSLELVD